MTGLFVGVDGGKSKTLCLVADANGTVLGWGRAGSADKAAVPVETAIDTVAAAVDAATGQANVTRQDLAVGCFGLAGADWREDFDLLHDRLIGRGLATEVVVKNDAQIALRAASITGFGLVLSAGTHLSVALRTTSGVDWFSGWSSVDGPGGAEAGRRVVWAVLHAEDSRGPATKLSEAVRHATELTPDGLLRAVANGLVDESFMARLAPLLFEVHARSDDPVAGSIIAGLGREMARWVTGLIARFDLGREDVEVFLTGGLFRGSGDLLRDSLAAAVHLSASRAYLIPAQREPVVGALFEAYDQAGVVISADVVQRLTATSPPPSFFKTD
jgi:N-acetylglucosamine kinase-like BadF-type ATPase